MGQKVNPIGLRLKVNKTWDSNWYADKNFCKFLHEDIKIRDYVSSKVKDAGFSKVIIERTSSKKLNVNIYLARPGVILSKKRNGLEDIKKKISSFSDSDIRINIVEVRKPELDAQIVANGIANQLEKRISFRRAMKKAVQGCLKMGAEGVRINCSGRLGGAEIARMEWYREGRVPLHTLRADIDYAEATAHTTYGTCGIKVWICKGENTLLSSKNEKNK